MLELKKERVEEYLFGVYKKAVTVLRIVPLNSRGVVADLKGFGYGVPYLVEFKVSDELKHVVLETMRPEGFGHDYFSDRAAILLWQHSTFNKLPKHVRSVDVGSFAEDGETLRSLGDCCEFFIVTEFADGMLYHCDLDRIKETGVSTGFDEERCLALSDYLVKIHSTKKQDSPDLYIRRIRDLVGHSECIFGLIDSYPRSSEFVDERYFTEFEKSCVEWRWRLKAKAHRISQVHGDFHPWNVLFREGFDFTVLDRSRGEWGEPADDVSAMTINYIFYSLQMTGEVEHPFLDLFRLFWRNYIDRTCDDEIKEVIQPFYAWRSLIIASPRWYPNMSLDVRKKIFRFATQILKTKKFDFEEVNSYIK